MMDLPGTHGDAVLSKLRKVKELKTKALDEVRFLRTWVESPLKTGAVSPSGPLLAEKMASFITPEPGAHFVELGPGTGVVTKAILDRGVPPQNLVSIEYSDDFYRLLRKRFPDLNVIQGDAYALGTIFSEGDGSDFAKDGLDGIVSSLPLFSRSEEARECFVLDALKLLKPGAPLVQFSYALVPPVKPRAGMFSLTKSEWIWKNLPPARVWVYRRVH
ncbi:class I SAM-dependent methyltransferase [Roseibium polysiphoniae]|uniref:Methyltransferase domain-containing protein n=1 Tax=Roseibium polysiphoniae TaxID=2571221 RepID=A0ABR9CFJ3_9HYPH|nr:rRNA adenine N-6-methyltransferase family protein [Roseibium polysiphoniae]MBD8878643.1 methyltransferase domain-containing protein [Roseibium polysiphoniae]